MKPLLFIVLCVGVLLPTGAHAQVHLQLLGGVTRAAEQAPFVGAALGARISFIEIDVEGGRFTNILSKGVLDGLNQLQRDRGLPVQAIASVPATYALGSLRVIPGAGPLMPFIAVGFGVVRLSPRFDVVVDGISLGDVFGLASLESRTEPMAAVGAGLRIGVGAVHVEGGYRYLMIVNDFKTLNFNTNSTTGRVNSVYAALGVGF